jgi:predicted RNA-binding protein YlxR (DUF448 family)
VGCRATAPKSELVRIVRRQDGVLQVDPAGREPGRGAYLHPDQACVARAERSGGLARALRSGPEAVRAASLTDALHGYMRESE